MADSPRVAQRRKREKLIVSQMIALYCTSHAAHGARTTPAWCGELVCEDCAQLDRFAIRRTEHCPNMEIKTSCSRCAHPCYGPTMQQRIREVMRFSGPRMLWHHPIAAIRHLIGR